MRAPFLAGSGCRAAERRSCAGRPTSKSTAVINSPSNCDLRFSYFAYPYSSLRKYGMLRGVAALSLIKFESSRELSLSTTISAFAGIRDLDHYGYLFQSSTAVRGNSLASLTLLCPLSPPSAIHSPRPSHHSFSGAQGRGWSSSAFIPRRRGRLLSAGAVRGGEEFSATKLPGLSVSAAFSALREKFKGSSTQRAMASCVPQPGDGGDQPLTNAQLCLLYCECNTDWLHLLTD